MENYFNYFTEIEECYRRVRGTPSLLSTLDWALIESWKEAGIPLEAVVTGIERSFEKYNKRARRGRRVNSLAYCAQEIVRAAEEASADRAARPASRAAESPFSADELAEFFGNNAEAIRGCARRFAGAPAAEIEEVGSKLTEMSATLSDPASLDFESLERELTVLEEKLAAALTRAAPAELLVELRAEADRAMARYRRAMTAAEIERLERQLLKKRLFERFAAPRLSLFYL